MTQPYEKKIIETDLRKSKYCIYKELENMCLKYLQKNKQWVKQMETKRDRCNKKQNYISGTKKFIIGVKWQVWEKNNTELVNLKIGPMRLYSLRNRKKNEEK